jgi:hypothetical protein
VATAGPKKATVKRQPDGSISLKQVAHNTNYKTREQAHAELGNDAAGKAALEVLHYGLNILQEAPGGILNGAREIGTSKIDFTLTGGCSLPGFTHTITLPANFEVHSAPRRGTAIETFDTNMYRIQGVGQADAVFEYVRLIGGTANGYPSPGRMTLASTDGNQVEVESFFNVSFRIEYKGAAGGPFAGIEDSVEGSVIMRSQAASGTGRRAQNE